MSYLEVRGLINRILCLAVIGVLVFPLAAHAVGTKGGASNWRSSMEPAGKNKDKEGKGASGGGVESLLGLEDLNHTTRLNDFVEFVIASDLSGDHPSGSATWAVECVLKTSQFQTWSDGKKTYLAKLEAAVNDLGTTQKSWVATFATLASGEGKKVEKDTWTSRVYSMRNGALVEYAPSQGAKPEPTGEMDNDAFDLRDMPLGKLRPDNNSPEVMAAALKKKLPRKFDLKETVMRYEAVPEASKGKTPASPSWTVSFTSFTYQIIDRVVVDGRAGAPPEKK